MWHYRQHRVDLSVNVVKVFLENVSLLEEKLSILPTLDFERHLLQIFHPRRCLACIIGGRNGATICILAR